MAGSKNPMYGKKFITNGIVNKVIPKGDKVPEGWRLGMAPKKKRK